MRGVHALAHNAQVQTSTAQTRRDRYLTWASEQVQSAVLEALMFSGEPSIFIAYVAVQPTRAIVPTQPHEATV